MCAHLDWFLECGRARGYGPDENAMWMSGLDLGTGRHPDPNVRPEGIEKRCYRWIESPWGRIVTGTSRCLRRRTR